MAGAVPSIQALQQGDVPFVLADHEGNVLAINPAFQLVYGWTEADLVGRPITLILPESFRMSHQLGFSRYQSTEKSEVLGHPLRLRTVCSDGRELISEHFIVAEKLDEVWRFGATLTPLADDDQT
ncbi:MAG: PAS domain S-box protein [Synechococcaceae cyanobacterium]|nr:PAS domain S-box protein [Synechococcaceae cyanobacterium]